ncbi:MAG: hypothetical protein HY074_15170 [Deltaproteobacteria bacterium]|nr:hypothetical protein [Deltaproteobacteria bacterium]
MGDEQKPEPPLGVHKMPKSRLSRSEKLMVLLGLQIVAIMAYSYLADVPLRVLFSLDSEEKRLSSPIGTVTEIQGSVKRQRASDFEFKQLTVHALLYPNDTILTGPDSWATIVLNNGRKVRITPNSLIRLNFGSEMSKDGISINVLQGGLAEDAGRMVPLLGNPKTLGNPNLHEKIPLEIVDALPAAGTQLRFTEEEFVERKKPVKISVTTNRKGNLGVDLFYEQPATRQLVKVASAAPVFSDSTDASSASLTFSFDRPGLYEWQVRDEANQAVIKRRLRLLPDVKAIHVLPTLNASARMEGNAPKKNFDGLVLRWAPMDGTSAYFVRVFKPGDKTPIFEKETLAPELLLPPEYARFEQGVLKYSVEKLVFNGFLASSGLQQITITPVPPLLTSPAAELRFDKEKLIQNNNLLFFTWTKTNYTSDYEFELAAEAKFTKPLLVAHPRDNYFSVNAPAPGRYFWRVRSEVNGSWSEFSPSRAFKVDSENQ